MRMMIIRNETEGNNINEDMHPKRNHKLEKISLPKRNENVMDRCPNENKRQSVKVIGNIKIEYKQYKN